jgi:hypothetical protein
MFPLFATNNLKRVLADTRGARCYHCLGHPNIDRFVRTVDSTTILCPECGIDAVVPASIVPNDTTLEQWHDCSFGLLQHQDKYYATVYRNENDQVVVVQKSRGDIFGSVKFTGPLPKEQYPDEILRAENIKMSVKNRRRGNWTRVKDSRGKRLVILARKQKGKKSYITFKASALDKYQDSGTCSARVPE